MLEIRPLSDALGAEVSGLDLTKPLDDATVAKIRDAFLKHHLLCIRSAPLEPAEFARVAGYFGKPQLQLLRKRRHGETPEVSILESTYKRPEDKPDDMRLVRLSGWHTDDSYFATPAKATMLQSIQIPDSGGETKFCNMRKAFLDLPAETQDRLDGLRAVHGYDTKRAPARAIKLTKEEEDETPEVDHPLVRTHEDTGEKTIYFNSNRTDRVVGMAREETRHVRAVRILDAQLQAPVLDPGRKRVLLERARVALEAIGVAGPKRVVGAEHGVVVSLRGARRERGAGQCYIQETPINHVLRIARG